MVLSWPWSLCCCVRFGCTEMTQTANPNPNPKDVKKKLALGRNQYSKLNHVKVVITARSTDHNIIDDNGIGIHVLFHTYWKSV